MNDNEHEQENKETLLNKENTYAINLDNEEVRLQSLGECLGMFFFVSVIGYSSSYPLFFGLYVVLAAFAPLSGAHFNPTITIGHFISFPRDSQSFNKVILYILAQLVGAFFAVLLKYLIIGSVIAPVIQFGASNGNAFFQEFFWGGWLVFVNLYVCSTVTSPSKHFLVNVAIFVACLFFNIEITKNVSGASLNPAIAIIGNLFGLLFEGGDRYGRSLWVNSVAPLCGGFVFAFLFSYIFEPLYSRIRSINHSKTELCNEENIKRELRNEGKTD